MVVVYHTLNTRASFTFISGVFTGNYYFAISSVKSGVFLVQLSWLLGFLSLVRMACYISNKWVSKYPGPESLPLSPLLSIISRKSTSILRRLVGAVTTDSCSWEKEKRNMVIDASFLVSTKPIAEGSWEVDDVGRTDTAFHSSGRIPEDPVYCCLLLDCSLLQPKVLGFKTEKILLCSSHQVWGVCCL